MQGIEFHRRKAAGRSQSQPPGGVSNLQGEKPWTGGRRRLLEDAMQGIEFQQEKAAGRSRSQPPDLVRISEDDELPRKRRSFSFSDMATR